MRVAVFDVAAEAGSDGDSQFAAIPSTSPTARRSRHATERVIAEWGVPHLLVNNAALDSPPDAPAEEVGPFETYPESSFDRSWT